MLACVWARRNEDNNWLGLGGIVRWFYPREDEKPPRQCAELQKSHARILDREVWLMRHAVFGFQ